jgi:hypothetical protein
MAGTWVSFPVGSLKLQIYAQLYNHLQVHQAAGGGPPESGHAEGRSTSVMNKQDAYGRMWCCVTSSVVCILLQEGLRPGELIKHLPMSDVVATHQVRVTLALLGM